MKRRRAAVLSAAGVVVVAGAGLATVGLGGNEGPARAHSALPPDTTQIKRTTLVETQQVDGTLGYGAPRTASGAGDGTLTWLPRPGDRIARGRSAYKVDNRPVPLLYGSLPLYRTLSEGKKGPDVKQFERNLRALGYTGFTVDDEWESGTTAAVKRWQDHLGLPETGTIAQGSVLIAPGEIRVAERKAAVGDRLGGGPVLAYTGTTRQVSVNLDVQYQRLARKGAEVSIELPEGDTVKGRVTAVGKVAKEGQGDQPTTISVTIAVAGQSSLGSYDKAPVTVHLTAGRHADVLAVPIAALLAQPGGGYAVQVVENGRTRMAQVETGAFSDGMVEISGSGLTEGMKVGIPK